MSTDRSVQKNKLTFLFALTYMVSYMTRTNFGAIISEIISATGVSKSLLSLALTGSFITYGIGQVISGFFGDRFSPKNLVCYGLIITVLMNFCIPFSPSPWVMTVLWCVNGFAQSLMWPPIVKMMTALMTDEEYKKSISKVSWGSSIGTILVYLVSPVIISFFNWKCVFYFSAGCGLLMILVWHFYAPDVSVKKEEPAIVSPEKKKNSFAGIFTPVMIFVMLAIIMQGILRDGVTTWMPSYLADTFSLSNSVSILSGVILPIFGIVCFEAASKLYVKKLRDPLSCGTLFFLIGTVAALGLYFFASSAAALSIFFFAVLIGCMHGVNLMLVCMTPAYFKKFGNVSTASGVINSCTYVGSAISTYGVALISEFFGWNTTILVWLGCAVIGTVLCFSCISKFREKFIL